MPSGPFAPFLRYVRSRRRAADADSELLARFAADRDEDAFAELVRRHGSLVWGVVRQILGHDQDAEDAFQATFLLLSRNAKSMRTAAAVAGWLHGTAWRVATKAKLRTVARRRREQSVTPRTNVDVVADVSLRELQAILHAEIAALPAKYRTPFVLCVLEGRGRTEVAKSLGWNEGTLSTRLAWARRRLRSRLIRRGVNVAAALAAVEVTRKSVPAALVTSAVTAARSRVIPAAVAALAHGGVMTNKLAQFAALGLVLGGIAVGCAGLMGSDPPPAGDKEKETAGARPDDPPTIRARRSTTCVVTITGSATGPDGKPIPGANVALCSADDDSNPASQLIAKGVADARGRYEFRDAVIPIPGPKMAETFVQIGGTAPGQPFAWTGIMTVRTKPVTAPAGPASTPRFVGDARTIDLTFGTPATIRGRVVDETGRPVSGAKICIHELQDFRHARVGSYWFPVIGKVIPESERMTATDADGRFRLNGAPRDCLAGMELRHPDYPSGYLTAATGENTPRTEYSFTGDVDVTLFKPRTIPVRVIDGQSGKPVPKAQVEFRQPGGRVQHLSAGETGADGRVILRMPAGDCSLTVDGPHGGDLVSHHEMFTVNTTAEQPREVRLIHGCRLQVEAVDDKTGRPLTGVRFRCMTPDSGGAQWICGSEDTPTNERGVSRMLCDPGKPLIVAQLVGYETITGPTGPVDLPAGGEVKLRFELRRK